MKHKILEINQNSLNLAEELIKEQEFDSALEILKNLENTMGNDIVASSYHKQLMLNILDRYRVMNKLDKTPNQSSELAHLYLGFAKYKEAKNIFEKLLKESSKTSPLIIYGLVKCYMKLNIELFPLEQFFHIFLTDTFDLSEKKLEFMYKTIGTFYLKTCAAEEQAIEFYKKALQLNPNCPELNLFFLALAFKNKNLSKARQYIHNGIKNTKSPAPLSLAIKVARELQDQQLYEKLCEELCEKFPEYELAYFYKSLNKNYYGLIDESLSLVNKTLEQNPQNSYAHDNLIMMSHYSPNISDKDIKSFADQYYENIIKPLKNNYPNTFDFSKHYWDYQKNGVLRIGFVSGDFALHPIFFWISALLKHIYNENQDIEIYCYVNNGANPISESMKALTKALFYINDLSDESLAQKIFNDDIHILIDLSGHTAGNRLHTFGLKPAPVQLTWLGQVGTTGLREIDYILTDRLLVKETEKAFYTEEICYLPFAFSYPAKDYTNLYINRSLARQDNKIVFGSFNNSMKINYEVIKVWAEILKEVPNSQILISNHFLEKSEYQKNFIENFKRLGIDQSRLEFEAATDKNAYLFRFSKIDIALDPFPFSGGTTTHETLMMSVPLITIMGERWSGRMSADILKASKLDDLIAKDIHEYISKAIHLAQSPQRIIHYKKNIRESYLNSPAADMEGFTKCFTKTIKDLWQKHLNNNFKN